MRIDPRDLGAKCAQCPLSKDGAPSRPVMGEGPRTAKGVFCAEGPGPVEAETGRVLDGPTGKEWDKELERLGIRRQDYYVTNAMKCQPPSNKNEAMMRAATKCCRPALAKELEPYRRLPTFAMGKWAYYGLTGVEKGVGKGRGFVRPPRLCIEPHSPALLTGGLIYTWHPTYAFFKDPYQWGTFRADLERYQRLVEGRLRPGPSKLIIRPTVEAIHAVTQRLPDGRPAVAVDIETAPEHKSRPWTGKDPTRAKLKTLGLGNADWGLSFVWGRDARLMKHARDVLLDPRIVKIFQNGWWFDQPVLTRYGTAIPFPQMEDTRDARKSLVATGLLNLGYLSCCYDDPGPWKEADEVDEEEDAKGLVFTSDLERLCRYNAEDAVRTFRVFEGEVNEAEWKTPRVQRIYGLLKRRSQIAAGMFQTGFEIDPQRRTKLKRQLASLHAHRRKKLLEQVKIPGFSCNPNHLRALIYKRHELPPSKTLPEGIARYGFPDPWDKRMWTKGGSLAVDQDALLILYVDPSTPEDLRTTIDLYWQAVAPVKAKSTFVDSDQVEHAIGADGRLRAGWNSCGPDTYRWSCSEPNLMNLSEKKE